MDRKLKTWEAALMFGVLIAVVAGSWLGLKIASRWLARLPDRWHVRIYPLLLIAVLLVMSVRG